MRGSEQPPSLYAFDPDIGRLAVTTPVYNTAIVAVNQHAFPYGGIELARLFDGEQGVAANVGGRAPAAFGLLVREPGGAARLLLADRPVSDRPGGPAAPHARDPPGRGRVLGAGVSPGRSDDLRARGVCAAGRFGAVTSHRFTPSTFIETHWRSTACGAAPGCRRSRLPAELGARGPRRRRPARGHAREPPAGGAVALARRGAFEVHEHGAAATPSTRCAGLRGGRPGDGSVTTVLSSLDPGPTLAVEVARGAGWQRARFAVADPGHTGAERRRPRAAGARRA